MALAIFSIGVMAVASMQINGMNGLTLSRRSLYDVVTAGDYLEQILAMSYDDPRLSDTDMGFQPDTPDHGPFDIPDTASTIEWEVKEDDPVEGTKRIRVSVRYTNKNGSARITSYEYLKSKDFR